MISIGQALRGLNEAEPRIQEWYLSFTGLFSSVEAVARDLTGEAFLSSSEAAQRVRRGLDPRSEPAQIAASGNAAREVVQQLVGGLIESRAMRERELKKIISITAEAGAVMATSGQSYADEIRGFASQIEATSNLDSVVDIRRQMTQRLSELHQMAERIQEDGQTRADNLIHEMERVQERLKQAESLAETDMLTGVGNRRYFEKQLARRIECGVSFCVVIMDLDGFKCVNDQYGHTEGDRLLKSVASALSKSIRETDCVGRWGGDEFVMLLHDIPLVDAVGRVSQIQRSAFGEFMLDSGISVNISACFGVAEHQSGESAEMTIDRADQNLYHMKRELKASQAARHGAGRPSNAWAPSLAR